MSDESPAFDCWTGDDVNSLCAGARSLEAALGEIMRETGTSTLAHHIARDALATLTPTNEPGETP